VDESRLAAAFAKHAQLRRHFTGDLAGMIDALQAPRPRWRQRILGRLGAQHHAIGIDRVAYFVCVDKITHAVALDGARYVLDVPLADLEPELDPARFFRANRQLLVSASSVLAFQAGGKGRLVLTLQPPAAGQVAVSQERAALFRQWLAQ
jgi:DNA-binding LytR/AlgR family response regulator